MDPKYEFHPAANIFPLMSEDEFIRLKTDIADNGQQEDILLINEQIIDGRNRYRAVTELRRTPQIAELDSDTDPVSFVLSMNLHRRQLKESQRAMCAAKMAGLPHGGDRKSSDFKTSIDVLNIDEAAKIFFVSSKGVDRALAVLRDGCKTLIDLCDTGELTVSRAINFIKEIPGKKDQAAIAKDGKKAVGDAIPKPKPKKKSLPPVEKMNILSMLDLACKQDEEEMVVGYVDRWLEVHDHRSLVDKIHALVELATDKEKATIKALLT